MPYIYTLSGIMSRVSRYYYTLYGIKISKLLCPHSFQTQGGATFVVHKFKAETSIIVFILAVLIVVAVISCLFYRYLYQKVTIKKAKGAEFLVDSCLLSYQGVLMDTKNAQNGL